MRRVGFAIIAALVISTIIILILLTLGITVLVVPNSIFMLGAVAVLSVSVIGGSFVSSYINADDDNDSRCCTRRGTALSPAVLPVDMSQRFRSFLSRTSALIVLSFFALVLVVALSFMVVGGTLTLTLLPLWILIFLILAILLLLLARR